MDTAKIPVAAFGESRLGENKHDEKDVLLRDAEPVLVEFDQIVPPPLPLAQKFQNKKDMSVFAAITANLPEHFEVLDLLGQGGSGAIFKVRDTQLDKIFAVKVMRSSFFDRDSQFRFEKEAGAAQMLTHANVVAVFNSGVGRNGAPYMVMEYLDGTDLEKMIKAEGCIDVPRALDLFIQVADSLAYAHEKGIVHRDIKSSNIIVQKFGDGIEIVKIVDFGTAFQSVNQEDLSRSGTGAAIGSPPYMSPEQCSGDTLDARTDIYSLGCVMYETLSGATPFAGDNPVSQIVQHLKNKPLSLQKAAKDQAISSDLENLVMRCLEKDPRDRYQSAAELKADLNRVARNEALAFKVPIPKIRWPRRKRVWFSIGAVILLACAIVGIRTGELWQKNVSNALYGFNILYDDGTHLPSPMHVGNAEKLALKYYSFEEYDMAIPLLQFVIESIENSPNKYESSRPNLGRYYKMLARCYTELKKEGDYAAFLSSIAEKKELRSNH